MSPRRRASRAAPVRMVSRARWAVAMTWKGSRHSRAWGGAQPDQLGDPVRAVARHQLQPRAAVVAQGVEEPAEGLLGAPVGGVDQPTGVVVDDHREVLVAAPVGHLVDPDPGQPDQRVRPDPGGVQLGHHPGDGVSDRAPGGAHQLGDRGLRGPGRQPGQGVLEGPGEPRAVPGPRHRRCGHPVLRAADPRHPGPQQHPRAGQIQPAPATRLPPTLVIAHARRPAPPAPQRRPAVQPQVEDQHVVHRVVLDRLEHTVLDPKNPFPYAGLAHAAHRPKFLLSWSTQKPRPEAACRTSRRSPRPHNRQESPT